MVILSVGIYTVLMCTLQGDDDASSSSNKSATEGEDPREAAGAIPFS